jgi:hypothetical protein
VGTIFIGNSEEFTNSAYFAHKKAVSFPVIVRKRGLTAKVYGKKPNYPYYRATWMDAGKQKQKACRKLPDAKKAARDALKQIARGKTNLPSSKEINDLRIAQVALRDVDAGPYQAAHVLGRNGTDTSDGEDITVTANYKIWDGVMTRFEYRYTNVDDATAFEDVDELSHSLFANVIYEF